MYKSSSIESTEIIEPFSAAAAGLACLRKPGETSSALLTFLTRALRFRCAIFRSASQVHGVHSTPPSGSHSPLSEGTFASQFELLCSSYASSFTWGLIFSCFCWVLGGHGRCCTRLRAHFLLGSLLSDFSFCLIPIGDASGERGVASGSGLLFLF
jgi:hypothetical protein